MEYFKQFKNNNKNKTYYTSHSHHFWPDITKKAMMEYWDDSAKYVDEKWDYIFSQKIPKAQKLVSEIIGVDYPTQIVFAPNTHELVFRLMSALDLCQPLKILSSNSEFHSFSRQMRRLCENKNILWTQIPSEPIETFHVRMNDEIKKNDFDLIFFSQVFYNSGFVVNELDDIVNAAANSKAIICIDGYHGFCALPTSLKQIQDRVFYVAGGYKYAGAGEGCCFMYCQPNTKLRPLYTGWFAELEQLEEEKADNKNTFYGNSALRFAGSTMDYSAVYRLIAVLELYKKNKITIEKIHKKVQEKQKYFLQKNKKWENNLLFSGWERQGHFLTYDFGTPKEAKKIHKQLLRKKIITDCRGSRLRFGFSGI